MVLVVATVSFVSDGAASGGGTLEEVSFSGDGDAHTLNTIMHWPPSP